MSEDREAWDELLSAGFLHAARQAHTEATLAVFGALSRSAGFKELSYGITSYEVLETQLDRVFDADDVLASAVRRENLHGSPGWRYGRYRMLLKRHRFGAVRSIRWDRDSPTKQAVANQEYPDDPQLSLFGAPRRRADSVVTLVLAHSASEEPLEMELFLGRARLNDDGGPAWHWIRPLNDDTLGADPRRRGPDQPTLPLWADEAADVPVLPRPRGVEEAS